MRNPRKRRNLAAVFAAVGFAASIIALLLNIDKPSAQGAWFGIVVFGSLDFAIASIGFLFFHVTYRRQQKLLNGKGLLARWVVAPADAALFRANEKKHIDVGRRNTVKVRKESDAKGFEVVVSQEAIMVDEDFYFLADRKGVQWLPDVPPNLEFNMVTATRNGSIRWNIRFPIPASAEAGGRTVWDYFNRPEIAPDLAKRYRAMRKFGIICFLFAQLPLLFAIVFFNDPAKRNAVWSAVAIGGVASFAGMFIFIVGQLFLSKSKSGVR